MPSEGAPLDPSVRTPSFPDRSIGVLQLSSFAIVFAGALVAFSPAPAVAAAIGTDRASTVLTRLSSVSALFQIVLSPVLGAAIDSVGRKVPLACVLLAVAAANGAVSISPSVVTICMAQCIERVCAGFFFVASQAIIGDVAASNPNLMSSAIGVQLALISAAFFIGAIASGWLSEFGLSSSYGTSAVLQALNALFISLAMHETLSIEKRIPFEAKMTPKLLLRFPLSCTRILFGRSKEIRILAIIMLFQTLPISMDGFFQIFTKTEWNLGTKEFSSFVAIFGVIGIVANTVGSLVVTKIGIKHYTAVAALSSALAPIGAILFSFRGLLAGSIIGFLGSAQKLGVSAALIAEGAKSGVPQGELAGEQSSFLALCGVVGPIWYNTLYVQGKIFFRSKNLPFLFNALLAVGVFAISQINLS